MECIVLNLKSRVLMSNNFFIRWLVEFIEFRLNLIMFLNKESSEVPGKNRKRSKKAAQNRNNSIISASPAELGKEMVFNPNSHQSQYSLKNDISEQADLQKTIQKLMQEKDTLVDLVNSNEKELQFCNQIISQFIDLNELFKIKQNSAYDEKSHNWVLPKFVIQQRKTVFPKLQRNQLKEMLQNEMKQRKIIINNQNWNETKGDEENHKEHNEPIEGQGRPVTSISKYRQTSMYTKGCERYEDSRRSPILRKPKLKF